MSKLHIDTEKMVTASNDIKNYVTKIDLLLTAYVERMSKVPNETKEWQGNAAEDFVELVKKEYKDDFVPLMTNIKKYATELEIVATEHKNVVAENNV